MGDVNGWVWCLRKRAGFNVGRFDLILGEEDGHPGAHDFLSPAGFLWYAQHAGCMHALSFMKNVQIYIYLSYIASSELFPYGSKGGMLCSTTAFSWLPRIGSPRLSVMGHSCKGNNVSQLD